MAILLGAAALVGAYALLCNRLLYVTQPHKLYLARWAERLVSDPRLPADARWRLCNMLDSMYDPGRAWLLVALVPAAFASILWRRLTGRPPAANGVPQDIEQEYHLVLVASIFLCLSNSPAATVLFAMELAAFLLVNKHAAQLLRRMAELAKGPFWFDERHRHA